MASCILYQNSDATISIIDVPRSIEIAQDHSNSSRRVLSSKPLTKPYPSVEPKTLKARERLGEKSLNDLLLSKHLQFALDGVKAEHEGDWCLPRVVLPQSAEIGCRKRKKGDSDYENVEQKLVDSGLQNVGDEVVHLVYDAEGGVLHCNASNLSRFHIKTTSETGTMPPNSTLLYGNIASTRDNFVSSAPKFDLIILDPPWPNRSARRKKSYGIAYGNTGIRDLLCSIPLKSHLAEDGMVGIWITNKEAFRDMLLQPGGLFELWGVNLTEEWIWLKTTVSGEPICPLDSSWRKPYEILLVGKEGVYSSQDLKRRVLLGVPDLHSRKPNVKSFFDQVIQREKYDALEIFARNMTAGWWAWGNEALKFQMDEYWTNGEGNLYP